MTALTVRGVLTRAARLNGALASGDDLGADELADGMIALNSLKRSWFGTIIGPRLSPQDLTGLTAAQAENGGEYQIPVSTFTLTAPSNPKSGARFGVVDANLTFVTDPCTIVRNGRLINGLAANLLLNQAGQNMRFWFRGDTGNWIEEADYVTPDDVIEFPEPLIAFMPYMLAEAVAAEYGTDLRQDIVSAAAQGADAFARTYARRGRSQIDPPIGVGNIAPAQSQGR